MLNSSFRDVAYAVVRIWMHPVADSDFCLRFSFFSATFMWFSRYLLSPPHPLLNSFLSSSPLSSSITPSLFHSRLKTYLFNKSFPPYISFTYTGLPHDNRTGPITLIILFLVSHFNFLSIPCGRLSCLPVSFLLHVKCPLSYRIVSYRTAVV